MSPLSPAPTLKSPDPAADLPPDRREVLAQVVAAALLAGLYVIPISGQDVLWGPLSVLSCQAAFILLAAALRGLNLLAHPRSLFLAVPLALFAFAAALLVGLCAVFLSVSSNGGQLSFAPFCLAAFIVLAATLRGFRLLSHQRALFLAAPLAILALSNALFSYSFFTFANRPAAVLLCAVFYLVAIHGTALRESGPAAALAPPARTIFDGLTAGLSRLRLQTGRKMLVGALWALLALFVLLALLLPVGLFPIQLWFDFWSWLGVRGRYYDQFMFLVMLVSSWVYFFDYLAQGRKLVRRQARPAAPRPLVSVTAGATFLALVNLLLLVFTVIQATHLFSGGFLTLSPEVNYASYARSGFFQLLLVTAVNFALLLVFLVHFQGAAESRLLRWPLLGLCLFTGVLTASSFYRLSLYIAAYGFTPLRLMVATFLVMEIFWLGLTAGRLFCPGVPLGRGFLWIGLAFYLLGNFTGGDWLAARLNIALYMSGRLSSLGAAGVGEDGRYLLPPLLADERQVCSLSAEISPRAVWGKDRIACWERLVGQPRIRDLRDESWRNWSYFRHKLSDPALVERYESLLRWRREQVEREQEQLERAERERAEQAERAKREQAKWEMERAAWERAVREWEQSARELGDRKKTAEEQAGRRAESE